MSSHESIEILSRPSMFVVYQKSVRFLTSKDVAREIRDLTTNCSQWGVYVIRIQVNFTTFLKVPNSQVNDFTDHENTSPLHLFIIQLACFPAPPVKDIAPRSN